jgi:MFS family permease
VNRSVRTTLILSLYLPSFLLAFGSGMLIPVLPLYARSFGISYAMVGLVLASQSIGNLLGDVPSGVMMGRLGQRWSMTLGLAVLGSTTIAMGLARSVPELIIYSFVGGVGMALWNISRHAYMTNAIPLALRGRATATFGGINRIGVFAAPAIGGVLATAYGMRLPFYIYGGFVFAALAVVALFSNESDDVVHLPHRGFVGTASNLGRVFREHRRTLIPAGIAMFLGTMIRSGTKIAIPLYGSDVVGLDLDQIGLIVTLSAAVDMSMFYLAGVLMDRYGRKFASVPSFAIQGLGMALVPLAFSFSTLLLATLVIGFGNGIGSGTMLTLGSDLAPTDSMGEFLGMWRLIGDTGQMGAPLVIGSIADALSLSMATLAIAASGLGAAAVLALFVPETRPGHEAPAPAGAWFASLRAQFGGRDG